MNETPSNPLSLPASVPGASAAEPSANAETVQALAALLPAIAPLIAQALAAAPGGKPGYKTTEFWLTVVGLLFNVAGALHGEFPPWVALLVGTALTVIYNILRAQVKMAASTGPAISAVSSNPPETGAAVSLFPAAPASLSSSNQNQTGAVAAAAAAAPIKIGEVKIGGNGTSEVQFGNEKTGAAQ